MCEYVYVCAGTRMRVYVCVCVFVYIPVEASAGIASHPITFGFLV